MGKGGTRAVQYARRAKCKSNIKQITLALHNYHGTHGVFPSGQYYCQDATDCAAQGGHIEFKAERQGSDVAVSVIDNGIGIPVNMRDPLFEMFEQIDSPEGEVVEHGHQVCPSSTAMRPPDTSAAKVGAKIGQS